MNKDKKYELHFAPLQGYTDEVYRNAFDRFFGHIDTYYTPFIRLENGLYRKKDMRELEGNTVPSLVPQILPGSADEFRTLTSLVAEKGYKRLDINMGCPFPMIAGKRKGAGILPYPEQVKEVLEVINEYPELSFSLKIRLGWESADECMSLIEIFNNLRLLHITVHARIGKQQYKGTTDLDSFEKFYNECRVPLFYNGDLTTLEDIDLILTRFDRLRGIMVGRGLLASPSLAAEFHGENRLSPDEAMELYRSFHRILFDGYAAYLQGDSQLLTKMKSFWDYFLPETDRKLLKKIKKANKIADYATAVGNILTNR